jgi:hypothetical protein
VDSAVRVLTDRPDHRPMLAYVDESVRLTGDGRYVLAAVTVPPARSAEIRSALVAVLRRGQRRYHWRDEHAASRLAMARLIGTLGLEAVAVTAAPVVSDRQERARRRCLPSLLWELDQRSVTHVVLETRQRHRDAADDRMIGFARRAGWTTRQVPYAFARPDAEPLLWLPDVVAGACARACVDDDRTYLDALGTVTLVNAP